MKKSNVAVLILAAGSALAAGLAYASDDSAAVGRVLAANGSVLIQRSVQTFVATPGSIIGVGDTVLTTDTGITQWQMSDDSVFAMSPDSGLKINKYALPSSSNPNGVASYTLLQGAVRTITGKIGKGVAGNTPRSLYSSNVGGFNPNNLIKVVAAPTGPYILKTATAIITTNGADFTAVQADKLLKVLVTSGSATVCTIGGCSTSAAGDGVEVTCDGCKPIAVTVPALALDDLMPTLQFPALVNSQPNDPRNQNTQACRTVVGQVAGGANCGGSSNPGTPGVPVSPN